MKKYEITAEVNFKIHWTEPAKSTVEVMLRDMAQARLDRKAHDFAEAMKILLTSAQPDDPNEDM